MTMETVGKQGDGRKSGGQERGHEESTHRAAEQDPGLQGPCVGGSVASDKAVGWRLLFGRLRDLKGG